jgi:hypothetical protein
MQLGKFQTSKNQNEESKRNSLNFGSLFKNTLNYSLRTIGIDKG